MQIEGAEDSSSSKEEIFINMLNGAHGHPAEWASVTAAEIADALNWAEDALRDDLGHEPPPHPGVREAARVAHAYRYFTDQFDRLCRFEAAPDTAVELEELHRRVRLTLGQTRFLQRLPTPCPWCDVAALVRDVDQIQCRNPDCGKVVEEKFYGWLAGWIVDQMIAAYDVVIEPSRDTETALI